MELLKSSGITFAEGTSATLSTNGVLLVTNTPTELDKVEQLVERIDQQDQPKQVKITTKFVEISQENNDELGFDWIVSPFGLNSEHRVRQRWHHRQRHWPHRCVTSSVRSTALDPRHPRRSDASRRQHRHRRHPQR